MLCDLCSTVSVDVWCIEYSAGVYSVYSVYSSAVLSASHNNYLHNICINYYIIGGIYFILLCQVIFMFYQIFILLHTFRYLCTAEL